MTVNLTGNDLTFEQLFEVSLHGAAASLTSEARARMLASRAVIERIVAAETTAYGVNTGFGDLAEVRISPDQIRTLQVNLVRSHACGVGAPLSEMETRAIVLLRANALAKGLSGVRPTVVEALCAMLKHRVHPVIPSQGSVGASGDLAPLVLEAKEGISLLNGTQGMLALLSLALHEAQILIDTADVAAALSLDALRGSPAAFDPRIAAARGTPSGPSRKLNSTSRPTIRSCLSRRMAPPELGT